MDAGWETSVTPTGEPRSTLVPAGGDWPITVSTGHVSLGARVCVPSVRCMACNVAVAASSGRHDDEMSGTVTLGKGEATVSVIVSPATTGVLGSGLCCRTVPAGFALCLVGGGSTTTRRRPSSWDLAASKVLRVTSGSWNACAASLLRRTCARRYPPAASRPQLNRQLRTPSQPWRDEPT